MSYWKQSRDNIWVAAHRGWCAKYPENSMEAFRAALEIGVDQIETDVRITKDGELVLFHDPTVDRISNGTGLVRDFTFSELRALDIGSYKGPQLLIVFDLTEDIELVTNLYPAVVELLQESHSPDEIES